MREFINTLKRYLIYIKYNLIIISILTLISAIFNVLMSIFTRNILDEITYIRNFNSVLRTVSMMFVMYIVVSVINIICVYLTTKAKTIFEYTIRENFFDKIQRSSYLVNIGKRATDIYYRMFTDISILSNYLFRLVIECPVQIIVSILYLIIMFRWSKILTIYLIFMIGIQIFVTYYIKSPIKKSRELQIKNETSFINEIEQHFNSIETIKIFGLETIKLNNLNKIIRNVIKSTINNTFIISLLNFISNTLGQITFLILLLIGSYLILNNTLSIGTFITFYLITNQVSTPINKIIAMIFEFENVKVSLKRYKDFISEYDTYMYSGNIPFQFKNNIRFVNIGFNYDESIEVIKGINLYLKPGEVIGISGESGGGKSTFAKILLKLLKPKKGKILIDDINLKDIDNESIRKNILYLSQTPYILNGSIKDNIYMNNAEIDKLFVEELIKKTGVNDIINKFDLGIETIIGKDGVELSLGEKQRITLVRLLAQKPRIVVLDEPTASLNFEFDLMILKLLKEYAIKYNALVIVISHKKDFLDKLDYTYKLKNGYLNLERKDVLNETNT